MPCCSKSFIYKAFNNDVLNPEKRDPVQSYHVIPITKIIYFLRTLITRQIVLIGDISVDHTNIDNYNHMTLIFLHLSS